LAGS